MARAFDYKRVSGDPKLFGFVVGWIAQKIACLTHAAITSDDHSCWETAETEAYRLASMCIAWVQTHKQKLSRQAGELLTQLLYWFGRDGYWSSEDCRALRVHYREIEYDEDGGDGRAESVDERFFPDVRHDPGAPYPLSNQRHLPAALLHALGQETDTQRFIELGVAAAALSHCCRTRNIVADARTVTDDLLLLELLGEKQVQKLRLREAEVLSKVHSGTALKVKAWTDYRAVLFDIFGMVCACCRNARLPYQSDVTRPPTPKAMAAAFGDEETTQPEPRSEEAPARPAPPGSPEIPDLKPLEIKLILALGHERMTQETLIQHAGYRSDHGSAKGALSNLVHKHRILRNEGRRNPGYYLDPAYKHLPEHFRQTRPDLVKLIKSPPQ